MTLSSWERRLLDVLLAGGAIAVAGCSSSSSGTGIDECCNANPDPCCPSLSCGAEQTPECKQELACQADGGTWDIGAGDCSRDAGAGDSGPDGDAHEDSAK
jgi:hypothetical protein